MKRLITTLFCGFVLWQGSGFPVSCDMEGSCGGSWITHGSHPIYSYHSDYPDKESCIKAQENIHKKYKAERERLKQQAIKEGKDTYHTWAYTYWPKCLPVGHNPNN